MNYDILISIGVIVLPVISFLVALVLSLKPMGQIWRDVDTGKARLKVYGLMLLSALGWLPMYRQWLEPYWNDFYDAATSGTTGIPLLVGLLFLFLPRWLGCRR